MIKKTDLAPRHLSAESSRRILYKLCDLNLSAERLRLAYGRRVDFKGCLDADAPVADHLLYRLRLDDATDCLFAIALDRGRLHLALFQQGELKSSSIPERRGERSRYLNLAQDESGNIGAPQLAATIHPDTAHPDEVAEFLRSLALACLPAV